jgi:hypothetical protein
MLDIIIYRGEKKNGRNTNNELYLAELSIENVGRKREDYIRICQR